MESDTNGGRGTIGETCNCTRAISGDPGGKRYECRPGCTILAEDVEDTEHNGQAVWPPGGPREHRTTLSAKIYGPRTRTKGPC